MSLFSGAGGMDLGFARAGFDIHMAIDREEPMCLTHRRNFASTIVVGPPFHSGDVTQIDGEELLGIARLKRGEVALIVGGPPCQPFSIAANQRFMKGDAKFKRRGFADMKQGNLVDEYVRLVCEIRPEAFCLENVSGLAEIDNGRKLKQLVEVLRKAGYAVDEPVVVEAADYGIPQFRKRMFVLGARSFKAKIGFPFPVHGEGLFFKHQYRTVAHALVGLKQTAPNNVAREHKPESLARYRKLRVREREPLGRVDRLDPAKPSKTVIAGGSQGGGRSHLHPFIARTLSVRECARLQTFDDDFVFEGSIARQFTQVGNAVPPLLAERIARYLMRTLFDSSVSGECVTAGYLNRNESAEELCEMLLEQSQMEKPEWLYEDVAVGPTRLVREAGIKEYVATH